MTIDRNLITGCVLAGGQGRRMGGVDKGLQLLRGRPLVGLALQRLAPQVGALMVNANRNLDAYAAFGVPVWPDTLPGHPGPLAGFATALAHCATPWLATVPCDAPLFPADLVQRLAAAAETAAARLAYACTEEDARVQPQPVFALLHVALRASLDEFLAGGDRKIDRWADREGAVQVRFDDAPAFANANTLVELHALEADR